MHLFTPHTCESSGPETKEILNELGSLLLKAATGKNVPQINCYIEFQLQQYIIVDFYAFKYLFLTRFLFYCLLLTLSAVVLFAYQNKNSHPGDSSVVRILMGK